MQRKNTIFHHGEITDIAGQCISVRILQASACSTCAAAQLCKSSEAKEKVMKVRSAETDTYEVGETVRLQIDVRNGLQAAFLAYIVPLILIVAELVGVSMFGGSDGLAAIGCLLVLALYYSLLYALRDRISRKFEIKIIKQ